MSSTAVVFTWLGGIVVVLRIIVGPFSLVGTIAFYYFVRAFTTNFILQLGFHMIVRVAFITNYSFMTSGLNCSVF